MTSQNDIKEAVHRLRDKANVRAFVAATGAGARLQAYLWDAAGASAYLAGCSFTYHQNETELFLGFKPDRYCNDEAAIELAIASYIRARESLIRDKLDGKLDPNKVPVGIGLTAAVASSKEHRGDHRLFVASVSINGGFVWSLTLEKMAGEASRELDGRICDIIGLNALLLTAGLEPLKCSVISSTDISWEAAEFEPAARRVEDAELRELFFKRPVFRLNGTRGGRESIDLTRVVLLPGTFNPLHDGHRNMADQVERISGKPVCYTTTADSLHKPPLTVPALLDKAAQLRYERWLGADTARTAVFTHRDPLFIDKARMFPGTGFVIGTDTLIRLLDPVWYGNNPRVVTVMLEEFDHLRTRFYVFGREIPGKTFATLSDVVIPATSKHLFIEMPGRWDVSSTDIRKKEAMVL